MLGRWLLSGQVSCNLLDVLPLSLIQWACLPTPQLSPPRTQGPSTFTQHLPGTQAPWSLFGMTDGFPRLYLENILWIPNNTRPEPNPQRLILWLCIWGKGQRLLMRNCWGDGSSKAIRTTKAQLWVPALTLMSCEILGRLHKFPEPQFEPHICVALGERQSWICSSCWK